MHTRWWSSCANTKRNTVSVLLSRFNGIVLGSTAKGKNNCKIIFFYFISIFLLQMRPSASQIVSIASAPEFTHLIDVISVSHNDYIEAAVTLNEKSFEGLNAFQ